MNILISDLMKLKVYRECRDETIYLQEVPGGCSS